MTLTNTMAIHVAVKFGADSNEAVCMRLMVKAYLLRKGVSYEDCLSLYKTLMKKKRPSD